MRRFILWIAAISITFAIGVGADRLWWHFFSAPPPTPVVQPVDFNPYDFAIPTYVPPPPPPPAAPEPAKPHLILDYDPVSFQLWAGFYVMGPKPKEFADFYSIDVLLSPESKEHPGTISITTHVGDEYSTAEASFGLVTDRKLFFATSKPESGDFEYRFDGEFLRTDFDAVAGKNKAVLRGTLTRMKNGRTITQHEFTFRMEYVGC